MLLTSVAVAFHASLGSIEQNQKIASITQTSRVALHRVMAESRCADAVETAAHRVSILPPDDGSGMTLSEYELVGDTLWYRQRTNGVTTSYSLLAPADGVTVRDFAVSCQTGLDADGQTCTKDITARLDLQVDGNRFTVTASTNPRRSLEW